MAILFLSDLDLPMRGRTYREPDGPHVAIVRGTELKAGLDHVRARQDCGGLAILGPNLVGDLDVRPLAGKRVFVTDPDGPRLRDLTARLLKADAQVEWEIAPIASLEKLAEWALPLAGLVLAAGTSTRMGKENKLLLDLGGEPLVMHAVTAAGEGGCHATWAVVSDPQVQAAIGEAATCVRNPDPEAGQASSLRIGLRALPEWAAGAVMLLGDQPLVGARTVRMLIRRWRQEDAPPAVAAGYGDPSPTKSGDFAGSPGHAAWRPPVVIERSLWPRLLELKGDAGARSVLEGEPGLLDTVPAAGRPDDVDTPEDYARIVRLPRRTH